MKGGNVSRPNTNQGNEERETRRQEMGRDKATRGMKTRRDKAGS